jgi:hypothetical protein
MRASNEGYVPGWAYGFPGTVWPEGSAAAISLIKSRGSGQATGATFLGLQSAAWEAAGTGGGNGDGGGPGDGGGRVVAAHCGAWGGADGSAALRGAAPPGSGVSQAFVPEALQSQMFGHSLQLSLDMVLMRDGSCERAGMGTRRGEHEGSGLSCASGGFMKDAAK